jgi:Pentapeptide repeats (8 copies)
MTAFTTQLVAETSLAGRQRRTWTLVVAGLAILGLVVAALLACIIWIPRSLYPALSDSALEGVDAPDKRQELKDARLTLQNGARTSLVQGLSALLVLTGASVGVAATLRQVRATREQIRETARASQNQLALSEQGQLTDRYTKAVDQLGSKELDVRLGGIFALERIARDSPDDRSTIYAVISAFVRGHSPWPPRAPGQDVASAAPDRVPELLALAADVQAGLTALAHRHPVPVLSQQPGREIADSLDLGQTDLRRANLVGAQLPGVWFHGTRLQMATLLDANLRGAQLIRADLQKAVLDGAQLEGADLTRANLLGADLRNANLHGADLSDAKLESARADGRTRWPSGWSLQRAQDAGVQVIGSDVAPSSFEP